MASSSDSFLSPEVVAALIGLSGGLLKGQGQAGVASADRNVQRQSLIAQLLNSTDSSQLARSTAGLAAQGGPLALPNALQSAKNKRSVLGSLHMPSVQAPGQIAPYVGKVDPGFSIGPIDTSSLSDQALADSVGSYYKNVAQVNPDGSIPNFGDMGLGDAGVTQYNSALASQQGYKSSLDAGNAQRQALIQDVLNDKKNDTGPGTLSALAAAAPGILGALGGIPSGSSGNISKLIQDIRNHFRGDGRDSGPASIPGGSSDFGDWAANTDTFNPETGGTQPLDPNQLPGYSGNILLEALKQGIDPAAFGTQVDPVKEYYDWLNSQNQNQGGGGSENYGTSWWDE
jgi:hypothetical protein